MREFPTSEDITVIHAITKQLLDEHVTSDDWETAYHRDEALRHSKTWMIHMTAAHLRCAGVPSHLFDNALALLS
jgi:hypothetical protein